MLFCFSCTLRLVGVDVMHGGISWKQFGTDFIIISYDNMVIIWVGKETVWQPLSAAAAAEGCPTALVIAAAAAQLCELSLRGNTNAILNTLTSGDG